MGNSKKTKKCEEETWIYSFRGLCEKRVCFIQPGCAF